MSNVDLSKSRSMKLKNYLTTVLLQKFKMIALHKDSPQSLLVDLKHSDNMNKENQKCLQEVKEGSMSINKMQEEKEVSLSIRKVLEENQDK